MEEAALILDTHADIQELVKSGMPEPQAETVVRQRVRLLERNLASKADIAATNANIEKLRVETKADIEKLRMETGKLIAMSKNDLIRWFISINLGTAALVIAAIKLL